MAFAFFTVPARDPAAATAELNAFLRGHRVLAVDRRWVDDGANSYWAVCVDFLETAGPRPGPAGVQRKVDYKEVLKPDEFAVFAKLRDWRKQAAQAEAVPAYAIFTNEQLAEMVRARATTPAALGKIDGVGDGRVEKYGPPVLAILTAAWAAGQSPQTPAGTAG